MLSGQKERRGIADEVQNAGTLMPDSQKSKDCRQHQRKGNAGLRQCQDREKKPHTDDADVPQLPQPQRRFCRQVIRIDIDRWSPPERMREAAGVPAASCDVWLFRFRILIQRVLNELNEELFLLEVMGCQIVFQPLEEFCGDLYR